MLNFIFAILSATTGQVLLSRHDLWGLVLYALAILLLLLALRRKTSLGRWATERWRVGLNRSGASGSFSLWRDRRFWQVGLLVLGLASGVVAFGAASDNTYRGYGVLAWLMAVGAFLLAFWEREPDRSFWERLGLSREGWRLSWTALAVVALILLGVWFRFEWLDDLPPEMTSDHVEKLLDVHDLVVGKRPIFFERNTGREPWQFYWTFMFIRLFDLETKYFALKFGTAVVGLLMLPGVYLLGRELFGRWVGVWATLFAAVASWPVILSRVGLRFPFAPAATAWALFYLLRGLRDGRRNDFLLLGLWLGIGMQGYTAFRAMPLAAVVCWALALLFRPSSFVVRPLSLARNALLTILIAVVVFLPLGRYMLEHADNFWMRSASRMADPNQSINDGVILTFIKNLRNLAPMFHWQGDNVWINTLIDAPILDPLLGGLLILGLVLVLWRGWRLRDPTAPLLLIAGSILLLPSALSLAYPIENPSVVRTGGAIPVLMVIAALPLGLGMSCGFELLRGRRRGLLALGALALAVVVTAVNHQRIFDNYWKQTQERALNYKEIGAVMQGFVETGGDPVNVWIVAWPHWIDTRGAGIVMGEPYWDNVVLKAKELDAHVDQPRPRFYLLFRDDWQTLQLLQTLFPHGWSSLYVSERPFYSFIMFYVPPKTQDMSLSPHSIPTEFVRELEGNAHAP